jgi:hypothetical protein
MIYGYGTSEGVEKAWDTRGRGRATANIEEQIQELRRNKISKEMKRQQEGPISGYDKEKYGTWENFNKTYFYPSLDKHSQELREDWAPQKIDTN